MPQSQVDKPAFDHESKHEAMPVVDAKAEKKLLRKCDLALIPPLMVIYFLSFMDRTNIGKYFEFNILYDAVPALVRSMTTYVL